MQALYAGPPAWILLDLMLPDGCGTDVLRRVKSDRLASRVCVITGCSGSMVGAARTLGAEHVLTKPLDVSRLISVLLPLATSREPVVSQRHSLLPSARLTSEASCSGG